LERSLMTHEEACLSLVTAILEAVLEPRMSDVTVEAHAMSAPEVQQALAALMTHPKEEVDRMLMTAYVAGRGNGERNGYFAGYREGYADSEAGAASNSAGAWATRRVEDPLGPLQDWTTVARDDLEEELERLLRSRVLVDVRPFLEQSALSALQRARQEVADWVPTPGRDTALYTEGQLQIYTGGLEDAKAALLALLEGE
jgi:hypothetical protein